MAEKGTIITKDPKQAKDLADDGANVKLTKEASDRAPYDVQETKAIAKKVGAAVIKGLRQVGDSVADAKVQHIESSDFEVKVIYKNGSDDYFSFYIDSDDALHLQDFSFDKELLGVGVLPSGEAQVNVSALGDLLAQHWKSQDDERADNQYNENYGGSAIQKLEDKLEACEIGCKVTGGGYGPFTKYKRRTFKSTHGKLVGHTTLASFLLGFSDIKIDGEDFQYNEQLSDKDRQFLDAKEKERLEKHPEKDKIKAIQQMMKNANTMQEAPEGMSYVKVAVRDARKALAIIDDNPAYSKAVEISGSDTYYLADEDLAYDLVMDFGAQDIEVTDSNVDLDESHDEKRPVANTQLENEPAMAEPQGDEDMDVGHQDDEPDMLKQYAYEIAQYAAKLYKMLDKYDKMDGEVDFPNWWQSKVILAKEYISKATHYLEFEEKQPAIDQLALENFTPLGEDFGAGKVKLAKLATEVPSDVFLKLILRMGEEDQDALVAALEKAHPNKKLFSAKKDMMAEAGIAKIQKALDQVKKQIKTELEIYKTSEAPANKQKAVEHLKKLNAQKKQLEKHLDDAVAGTGRDQELSIDERQSHPVMVQQRVANTKKAKEKEKKNVKEEKATYCGGCGTTHKKSSGCPK